MNFRIDHHGSQLEFDFDAECSVTQLSVDSRGDCNVVWISSLLTRNISIQEEHNTARARLLSEAQMLKW